MPSLDLSAWPLPAGGVDSGLITLENIIIDITSEGGGFKIEGFKNSCVRAGTNRSRRTYNSAHWSTEVHEWLEARVLLEELIHLKVQLDGVHVHFEEEAWINLVNVFWLLVRLLTW